jgi:zinc transport system substrate-binding protein
MMTVDGRLYLSVACRRLVGVLSLAVLLIPVGLAVPVVRAAGRPLRVVASFYPMYVMTLNIAAGIPDVSVECLARPSLGCLHDYQLSPGDLVTLSRADVFVVNGAGMEAFLDKAARQCPRLCIVEATRGLRLANDGNPHLWVSVSGAIEETETIARGLAAADPTHANAYENNAASYVAKLGQLRAGMHAALDPLAHRNIITFHEAFPYFAGEFALTIVGVVEREPGSEPNARELAVTIKLVRDRGVRAIFAEPQYPAKSADIIRRETGVPVSILDPAATGDPNPARARDSYFRTMEQNLRVLTAALAN